MMNGNQISYKETSIDEKEAVRYSADHDITVCRSFGSKCHVAQQALAEPPSAHCLYTRTHSTKKCKPVYSNILMPL